VSSAQSGVLREYLKVVRRRKWIILAAVILVPLGALVFSLRTTPKYQGSAQVLLSQQDLGNQLTGTQLSGVNDPADRQAQTQADLARVPAVARRVVKALRLDMTPEEFLAASSVSSGANSDILNFYTRSTDRQLAVRLATAYANAYVRHRLDVETRPIAAARKEVAARIARTPEGPLYNSLVSKEQTLQELETLKTSSATVIKTGDRALRVAPRIKRNVAVALVLGLALGLGLAFLLDALDTRVRAADEVADLLDLPLLARLPAPPRKLVANNGLVMLENPGAAHAEGFRILRTNLEFAAIGRDVSTVLVTSAVEREGKSTTIANLAVAQAQAGRRVILLDLDLRRPAIDKFFGLQGRPGVTQVALHQATLDEALAEIDLGVSRGLARKTALEGSLSVLPAGAIPPNPGEFVGSDEVDAILRELSAKADTVLVDAPPVFHVGDGLALSAKVSAILVVARIGLIRRPMAKEFRRLLETMPAPKLGLVVTYAASFGEGGYGSAYGYGGAYGAANGDDASWAGGTAANGREEERAAKSSRSSTPSPL
jgi:polysaccharide biosynthesis transport protein